MIVSTFIVPVLIILWIPVSIYYYFKVLKLVKSKIDTKIDKASLKFDKKLNKTDQKINQYLKKKEIEWGKNPKSAIMPLLGVFALLIFVYSFLGSAFAKDYSKYSYIEFDCTMKVDAQISYAFYYLDKDKMTSNSEAWSNEYPQKAYQTRQILNWGKKITLSNITTEGFDYFEPYFKNDKLYMKMPRVWGSDVFSTDCKILEAE